MQKNCESYTFLLAHSSKSGIYFKRVALRKSWLHFGSVGLFLLLGAAAFAAGISGIVRNPVIAQSLAKASPAAELAARPAPPPEISEQIDYSRPSGRSEYAFNSGGPEDPNQINEDDKDLEERIRAMRLGADPAFLPTIWSHLGKINNEFGFRRNPFGGRAYEFHAGMDIDGERGDLVVAPANGTVIEAGYKGGYGNMIEIDHGNGLTTRYGHLSKIESAAGDTVTRGQLIATIGSTGRSTGPHLHYELRLNDKPINPRHFLPPELTDLTKIVKQEASQR